MPAGFRPTDVVRSPNSLAHRHGHDGIVAGGEGKSWAAKRSSRLGLIPVHQPAEPLIEPLDVERLGRGEGLGIATAPEGLKGLGWVAAKSAAHYLNPRKCDVRAETVEALNADQPAKGYPARLSCPLKQPEDPEGMADGDGVPGPSGCSRGSTGDEAELNEGHFGIAHKC